MSESQMLPGVQLRVDGDAVVCEGHRHECRRLAAAFRLMLNDIQRNKELETKSEAALFIAGTEIDHKERVRLMVQALSSEGEGEETHRPVSVGGASLACSCGQAHPEGEGE